MANLHCSLFARPVHCSLVLFTQGSDIALTSLVLAGLVLLKGSIRAVSSAYPQSASGGFWLICVEIQKNLGKTFGDCFILLFCLRMLLGGPRASRGGTGGPGGDPLLGSESNPVGVRVAPEVGGSTSIRLGLDPDSTRVRQRPESPQNLPRITLSQPRNDQGCH